MPQGRDASILRPSRIPRSVCARCLRKRRSAAQAPMTRKKRTNSPRKPPRNPSSSFATRMGCSLYLPFPAAASSAPSRKSHVIKETDRVSFGLTASFPSSKPSRTRKSPMRKAMISTKRSPTMPWCFRRLTWRPNRRKFSCSSASRTSWKAKGTTVRRSTSRTTS